MRAQERLREPAQRIHEKLRQIAALLREDAAKVGLIQVDSDGSVERVSLASIAALEKPDDIAGTLLLLPERLGNISKGMFRPEEASANALFDVADQGLNRCRYRIKDEVWTRIGTPEDAMTRDASRASLVSFALERGLRAPFVIRHPEEEDTFIVYFTEAAQRKKGLRDVPLLEHQTAVGQKARSMALSVGLTDLADTFAKAGEVHDAGKHHPIWQRAMGGTMDAPIAKSKAPVNLKLIGGYRHELGSVLKAGAEVDDLLLHLVASHHAGARPFFEERQYDREALTKSSEAALESARRYARLQSRFGPWGLAYLEAVFKCADGIVSAEEGGAVSE